MSDDPSPGQPGITYVSFLRPDVASRFATVDPASIEAVPLLCDLLKDENPAHRKYAAEMLMLSGPDAAAVPVLVELLQHADSAVRLKAAELLAYIGPKAEPAIAALRALLADKDSRLQRWAARALGEIGPAAQPALPDLVRLRFTAADVRTGALAAVAARRIDPQGGASAVLTGEASQQGQASVFYGHRACVQCLAFTPDGRRAVSGSGQPAGSSGQSSSGSSNTAVLIPAETDFTVRLWDLDELRERGCFAGHKDRVTSVAVFPDGRRCLSGSYDGTLRVWDLETGLETQRLTGHLDRVRCVAVSPEGRYAVSGACDRTLRFWDLTTGRERCRAAQQGHWVIAVAFTPDGRLVLSGSRDGSVRTWNAGSGREVGGGWLSRLFSGKGRRESGPRPRGQPTITCLAFSPDGRRALSAGTDRALRLWEPASGQDVCQFQGHTSAVLAVAFTPDGRRVVSGGMDQVVRVWDVASGKEVQQLTGHTDVVMSLAVSPEGRRILSGGADLSLRLWRLLD